jgi:hypothetical protein
VVLGTCLIAWVAISSAAERAARWVETRLDAHLWRYEEWMQLLSPARYPVEGRSRILVVGPSESREAFWPEPFRRTLPDVRLVNDSLSLSTLEDAVTQLEYIERVYGRGALGDVLIVGVTPRFLQGYAPGDRPLPIVLNRYSPYYALDESVEPQILVRKSRLASLLARIRLAGHSGARYTKAVRAMLLAARTRARGGDLESAFRAHYLVASRFFDEGPRDKRQYYEQARAGGGYNPPLRKMDLRQRRAAVVRDFDRVRAIARRNAARVVIVNLPEGGWARRFFYDRGIHEAYVAVLREAVGDLPLVDLWEALPDKGFVDWVHPTMDGGLLLSRAVAAEIQRMKF